MRLDKIGKEVYTKSITIPQFYIYINPHPMKPNKVK